MDLEERPALDFARALLELRQAGYGTRRAALLTGIPVSTMDHYVNNRHEPNYENGRAIKRLYRTVFDKDLPELNRLE